ncbi:MAG: T9SS type A sorting domain-containing protein, partial [Vicingaceae bacterium]
NLTCIEVDDVTYSTTNWTNIDAGASFSLNCVPPCIVSIPDANFKSYLVGNSAINTNGDTEIQCSEASAFTGTINCNSSNISDLTGIEAFTNIPTLLCANNQLTTLDVSSNIALTYIVCDDNMITNLDFSNNTALTSVLCDNNQLTALNLTNCTSLEYIECYNNQISSLDVSTNSSLEELYCNNNQLTSIDISANSSLTNISCSDNQLTNLNLANGNNTNMDGGAYANVWALNNPNLTCIQKDVGYIPDSYYWNVDAIASYSDNCSSTPCTVTIPDANFKSYLVGNTAINTNGDTEIQCSEASAFTGTINVFNQGVTDLSGIESFTGLKLLNCGNNSLGSIDLSQNIALTSLRCANASLNALDISQNLLLITLICSNNSISNLDVSQHLDLVTFECNNNSISILDVSQHTNLQSLVCTNNNINTINTSQSIDLEYFFCGDNNLTNIDVSQNSNLAYFICNSNQLTSLNVANGNNINFTTFNSSNNPSLACIQVDDVSYSTTNWTNIDAGASFSTNCGTVGISEIEKTAIKIYPNPVQNKLFFELDNEEITELEIVDFSGRVVTTIANTSANSVDVSNLPQGIYVLRIFTENGITTNRFIKQ